MKELRDDRVHARMALVRDLFDLSVDDVARGEDMDAGALEASDGPGGDGLLAEVRSLPRRRA
jgi:hypothetical protein